MGDVPDLTSKRFGKCLALHRLQIPGRARWMCLCDCGKMFEAAAYNLKRGSTKSCGCLRRAMGVARLKHEPKHGFKSRKNPLPEYAVWVMMKQRCLNVRCKDYRYYGGRGVKVCQQWSDSFVAFLNDMGRRPKGMTLERKDTDGDYTPDNCCWASWKAQQNNRRNSRKRNGKS